MEEIERTFQVVSKGVKGKKNTPFVRFKSAEGESMELHFFDKAAIAPFDIGMVVEVQALRRQQTLG